MWGAHFAFSTQLNLDSHVNLSPVDPLFSHRTGCEVGFAHCMSWMVKRCGFQHVMELNKGIVGLSDSGQWLND